MLGYWHIERGLLVVVLRFSRVSWTLLWLVQYPINLLESNLNDHAFLFTVIEKAIAQILNPLSKFLSPHIFKSYGEATITGLNSTIWVSFPVVRSFAVQFGDQLRYGDHLRAGFICGPVQIHERATLSANKNSPWSATDNSDKIKSLLVKYISDP